MIFSHKIKFIFYYFHTKIVKIFIVNINYKIVNKDEEKKIFMEQWSLQRHDHINDSKINKYKRKFYPKKKIKLEKQKLHCLCTKDHLANSIFLNLKKKKSLDKLNIYIYIYAARGRTMYRICSLIYVICKFYIILKILNLHVNHVMSICLFLFFRLMAWSTCR